MKNLIKNYEAAQSKANEALEAWENDIENTELEDAFNKAYKTEFKALETLINYIVKATAGQINSKDARFMVATQLDTLKAIAEKE